MVMMIARLIGYCFATRRVRNRFEMMKLMMALCCRRLRVVLCVEHWPVGLAQENLIARPYH
jgi:hypothetical protein